MTVSNTPSVQLLDCTLRDGGYAIDFQFTAEDTRRISSELDRAGVRYIEVGHGLGVGAQSNGELSAAATDEEYVEAAVNAVDEASIGVFFLPGLGTSADLERAADAGVDFVRVGANTTEWEDMKSALGEVRDLDMTPVGNLLKSYAVSPSTLSDRAEDLESWGAEVVYVVDSAGGLFPEEVEEYVAALDGSLTDAEVGFHGHDNLSLGVANILAAVDGGAKWVDSTLQGMGRSAGNPCTEVLATIFKRLDVGSLDQKRLMDVGHRDIGPLVDGDRFDPLDVTAGFACFHSRFTEAVLAAAAEYGVDPRDLIVAVSRREVVDVTDAIIEEAARGLSETSNFDW